MAAIISLNGWEKFQHYKDRDPPWIKLYRDLLTSESWVLGTDCSRLVQVASVLLAARYENKIPFRWSLVKKVANLDCNEKDFKGAIEHLVAYNFLEVHEVTSDAKVLAQDASSVLAKCPSEAEQSREETEQSRTRTVAQERDDGPAEQVFNHWKVEFNHPRAQLDAKRHRVITAALKTYDEATLRAAISGYRQSAHHMGENERRTVYDDIELFLRDSKHIEAGLTFARGPPATAMSAVGRAREKLRNGNGNGRVVSEQFGGQSEGSLGATAGLLRRVPDS